MKNFTGKVRKIHLAASIIVAIPLTILTVSGLVLTVKKYSSWVQPGLVRGNGKRPEITFERMLTAARTVPEAKIETWADVDRLDVRPDKGTVKVQARNNWEVQVDLETGQVLHAAYRRSDTIESIHDGSWLGESAKLWLTLPTGVVLMIVTITGVWLIYVRFFGRKR